MEIKYEIAYLGDNGWKFKGFNEENIDIILSEYLTNIDLISVGIIAKFYDNNLCIGERELYVGYNGYTKEYKLKECFHPIPQCQFICEKIENFIKNA